MAKTATPKDGIKAMQALGYSQAAYARMFGVDSATVNQWYRLGQVGARTVGRVEHIKELAGKLTIKQLRPDLDDVQIKDAQALAKIWKKNAGANGATKKKAPKIAATKKTAKAAPAKKATKARPAATAGEGASTVDF